MNGIIAPRLAVFVLLWVPCNFTTGRKVSVINLDPANDNPPYNCEIDIRELISLEDVMDELQLGPNGGLVYCMEHLQQNADWLREKLRSLESDTYLLFDLPGQARLQRDLSFSSEVPQSSSLHSIQAYDLPFMRTPLLYTCR